MSDLPGGFKIWCLIFLYALPFVLGNIGIEDGTCTYRKWERPGTIKFLVIAAVHEPEAGKCGTNVSRSNFALIMALDWMVSILNGNLSKNVDSFIPGVTIGYDLYDNCDNVDMTTDLLFSARSMAGQATSCSSTPSNVSTYVGTIPLTNVESTRAIARLISQLPVVRPLPSAHGLEGQDMPNLLQTVVAFKQEALALVTLLATIDWNFVTIIHTDDVYGSQALNEILSLARSHEICVNFTGNPNADSITKIYSSMSSASNKSIALIYLGDTNNAMNFIKMTRSRPYESKINWVFLSLIDTDTLKSTLHQNDTFTLIKYQDIEVTEYEDFFDYIETTSHDDQFPFKDILKTYRAQEKDVIPTNRVIHMVDTVLAMTDLVKWMLEHTCNTTQGVKPCSEFVNNLSKRQNELIDRIKNANVDVNNVFTDKYLPTVYHKRNKTIKFTGTGAQELESLDFNMFIKQKDSFIKIGIFNITTNFAVITYTNTLPSSACKKECVSCRESLDLRYSYLHGDILMLGIFSLRQYGDSPYTCGNYRKGTNDIITVSSFMEFIISKRTDTGKNFGGIAIDDCYNALNTSHLLTELFSKKKTIRDPETGIMIDFDNVFMIIGPLSSPVSLVIGDVATALGIPMISYSASSPELDNRQRYPYFMRTVPSDDLQVKGMIDIISKLGITRVGAIYIDDAYGKNGISLFAKEAANRNICIETPLKVSQEMSDLELETNVIKKLYDFQVRVVIHFSIETIAKSMLDIMTKFEMEQPIIFIASEAWGTTANLVKGDTGKQSKGSIVFNIATRVYNNKTYKTFLDNLNVSQTDNNRWIPKYFEDYNKCDFLSSFEKSHMAICGENFKRQLDDTTKHNLYNDQRAVHIMYSVHAATEGYQKFCQSTNNKCSPLQVRSKSNELVSNVKAVKLDNENLFDIDGNGNIGYTLFNIQQQTTGLPVTNDYQKVGSYTKDGKLKLTDSLKFYNDLNENVNLTTMYNVHCSNYPRTCSSACILPTTTSNTGEPITTVTPAPPTETDSTMIITTIVFGVLLAILAVALVLVIVLLLRKQNAQIEKSYTDEAGHSFSMMSHHSNSNDTVYDEPTSVRRHRNTFDNIAGSMPNTPSHINGLGVASSVSSLNVQKPIEYAHIRQRSNPDLHFHHIKQTSNIEQRSQLPDHLLRPMSTLSAPTGESQMSPAMRRLMKPRSYSRSPNSAKYFSQTPNSAPTMYTRNGYRAQPESSPRFRYPSSNEECSYTLPATDMFQESSKDRRQGVSDTEDKHSTFDYKAYLRPESHNQENYLTPSHDNNDNTSSEPTVTYLTAKDLIQNTSDEEEDAEEPISEISETGVFKPVTPLIIDVATDSTHRDQSFPNRQPFDPNLISPSDNEVLGINFPQTDCAVYSKKQGNAIGQQYTKESDPLSEQNKAIPNQSQGHKSESLQKKRTLKKETVQYDLDKKVNHGINSAEKSPSTYKYTGESFKADDLSYKKTTNVETSLSEVPDVIKHGLYEEDAVFII